MTNTLASVVLVAVFAVAAQGQAPDRSRQPAVGSPPTWTPLIQRHRLSNGLPVWILEQHELPVVQMSLQVRTGTDADPPGRFGIASLTSAMLAEGAGSRSGVEIADALDGLVANLSASSVVESSYLRLYVPVAGLAAALPLMADVAQRPTFREPQLERVRRQRLGTLRGARDDPDAIAALLLAHGLFGKTHRSAAPQIGTVDGIEAITSEDLEAFHRSAYRPDNSTLMVVGDVDAERVLVLLETHFGAWQAASAPGVVAAATPAGGRRPARQLLLVDMPDAPQSRILVGGLSLSGSTADFLPIQVLNGIVRGRFSAAFNPALRDYTAGVRSGFDMRKSAAPFAVAAAAQGHRTTEVLREVLHQLTGILKDIPADELARAKDDLSREFSRTFEASGRISSRLQALESLAEYDLPDDHYATFVPAIQAVSAAEVRRVAMQYLDPDHLVIAIVGDGKTLEPRIRALDVGSLRTVSIDDLLAPAK